MGGLLGGRSMEKYSDILTDPDNSSVVGLTTGLGGTTATDEDDRTALALCPHSDPIAEELRGKRIFRCTGNK